MDSTVHCVDAVPNSLVLIPWKCTLLPAYNLVLRLTGLSQMAGNTPLIARGLRSGQRWTLRLRMSHRRYSTLLGKNTLDQ